MPLTKAQLLGKTEEMRQNLRRIAEELASSFVHGTIQWRKDIGHPALNDFGRAFVVILAKTQVFGGAQLPMDFQFDIPFSLVEDETFYRLTFRGLMPDTLNSVDPAIRHQALVEFVEGVSWLDVNGQPSAVMPVISPPGWYRFFKEGETTLPAFNVVRALGRH
jgi:hypothetical protein